MPSKYAIATCADHNVGEFLIGHWLKSLQTNVDLTDTDVVVLDYGLNPDQIQLLEASGVDVVKCVRDGHLVNVRFRDSARIFTERNYQQVMTTDGGDLIFQSDISHLFREPRDRIAISREPHVTLFPASLRFAGGKSAGERMRKIQIRFVSEAMLNVGVIVGPPHAYRDLWQAFEPFLISWTITEPIKW